MSGKPVIEYDGRQDCCPLPLINTKLLLRKLHPGQCLLLRLKDSGSKSDIPRWLTSQGISFSCHKLSEQDIELIIKNENTTT